HGFDFGIKSWRMTGGGGHDKLSFDVGGFSAKLELEAKKPVVLQYGNGAMLLGASDPFYYYSYTRMSVSGTLIVDGVEKSVSGTAWMDHQWGALGQNFDGWDWYSVRLDDNTELMLFRVRGDQHIAGGTYIHADGSYDEIPPGGFSVDVTGKWHSPHTDSTYPLGWVIKVPQYDLEVTVTPQISDQEFYVSSFGSPKYWEGLCTVVGTRGGQGVSGHAYVELTGYAK
ncbi:MAG: carotenoid 1,2-hydratase, partial [Myxococcales bacterium]|nr:carotenoid 1,2-hydratase [Myxococcales bacterium]